MAIKQTKPKLVYGIGDNLLQMPPAPIIAKRNPATNDYAQLGTTWVNKDTNGVYTLTSIVSSVATWATSPASGSGTFASVEVDTGDIHSINGGGILVDSGDITITAGNLSVGGDVTFVGDLNSTGDFDITSTDAVSITSSSNTSSAIYLHANGGTSEAIKIHSDQGTGTSSVNVLSDVGGITLATPAFASADAINLAAGIGGVDIDASLQINIASTQAASTAVLIDASDAAGGIEIKAGTGGISIGDEADTTPISVGDIAPTASRTITIGGGQVATAAVTDTIDIGVDGATANADSIKIVNIGTGALATGLNTVNVASGNVASGTHAVNVSTGTGTKIVNVGNADAATTCNIDAVTLINDSINANTSINTGTSTGVVAIGNAAAGAVTVDTAAGISIDGATASNLTVTGASEDLTLAATGGSVNITATEAVGDAIVIDASDAAGGISITAGTAGISIDSVGIVAMTPATATAASPTATAVINTNVGVATFTGFTTAAAAGQVFTITDSLATVGSAIFVSVSNLGANDAQMTVSRVTPGAGTFNVSTINNGAAALNGDVIITYWMIAA